MLIQSVEFNYTHSLSDSSYVNFTAWRHKSNNEDNLVSR